MEAPFFDSIAEVYDGTIPPHVAGHYLEKRVCFLRDLFPAGSVILDVGCGTGTLARRLKEEGYTVVGVDGSQGMLKVASAKKVAAIGALAECLPFADGKFDGVVSVALLHHLGAPDSVKCSLNEILRVTRRGGAAVIWDHNPMNPYWPVLMRRVPQDHGTERLVPRQEILGIVSRLAGARVSHCRLGFVPDFAPLKLLPLIQRIELYLESWCLTRWLAAHNVVVVRKE